MAQFARPSADTHIGNYTDEADGTTDIFTSINEEVRDDNDYVQSESAPANSPYVTKLSNITDPEADTGHTVRYAYAKDTAGGAQVDLDVELREGYVDEGTPGTVIADWTHVDIPDTFTQQNQTLTEIQAGAITDYTDLYLRIVSNQV